MKETTADSISLRNAGVVFITQQKAGHRFTLDSLLLADFCCIKPRDRILEPGAGTGIISLLLAKKYPTTKIIADEFEPRAFELLCKNIEQNNLSDNIVPLNRDINDLNRTITPHTFDVIVANPPYTEAGSGRQSPSQERHIARHDQAASLSFWLDLQVLLQNKGRYALVFPAQRSAELLSLLRSRNLEPKRIRFVHPRLNKPATLMLVEAVKNAGIGTEILAPLIVHEQDSGYTEEMKEIYGMGRQETGGRS